MKVEPGMALDSNVYVVSFYDGLEKGGDSHHRKFSAPSILCNPTWCQGIRRSHSGLIALV